MFSLVGNSDVVFPMQWKARRMAWRCQMIKHHWMLILFWNPTMNIDIFEWQTRWKILTTHLLAPHRIVANDVNCRIDALRKLKGIQDGVLLTRWLSFVCIYKKPCWIRNESVGHGGEEEISSGELRYIVDGIWNLSVLA